MVSIVFVILGSRVNYQVQGSAQVSWLPLKFVIYAIHGFVPSSCGSRITSKAPVSPGVAEEVEEPPCPRIDSR